MPEPSHQSAEALRRSFDRAFSAPRPTRAGRTGDYLGICAGGQPYAISVAQAAHLLPCPPITRLPATNSALLGVGAVRGALVALYDLAALLGVGLAGATPTRWLVLSAAQPDLGLAFEAFEGYLSVASDRPGPADALAQPLIRSAIPTDPPRSVVDLQAAITALQNNGKRSEEQR